MRLHHVGYIVKSINEFLSSLPHNSVVNDCIDEIQEARLVLVDCGSDVFIEIVEPLSNKSRLFPQIERSLGGINHVCYEGSQREIDDQIELLGLLKIFGPVDAPLFGHRMVEFYVNKDMSIIEFLYE